MRTRDRDEARVLRLPVMDQLMSFNMTKAEVWEGQIPDRPGGLAEGLAEVMRAGANLDFMICRPCLERPGRAGLFVAPLVGPAQTQAAEVAGLRRSTQHWVRLEGPDRPWLAAGIAQTMADAGINMRSLTGAVVGDRCVVYVSFDSEADARRATEVLTPVLG